jgi:RNA polymerase sigma factor (sigma-70 family)
VKEVLIMADLQKLKAEILADGQIDDAEVTRLRSTLYADGKIDKEGVEFLIDLRNKAAQVCPAFEQLFFQALKDNRPSVTPEGEGRGLVPPPVRGPQEGESPGSPHPSARQLRQYDLDLAVLEDEQLVVLAQESGYVPARDELICRCNRLKDCLIRRYAAHSGLQQADCMDAQQDAVLWILEAIREYHTEQPFKQRGCRFRSFLYRVLLSRFIDLLRRRGRRQARLRLGGYTFVRLSSPPAPQHHGSPAGAESCGGDPRSEIEQGELMARLHQELDRLGGLARRLWDLLVSGKRLREIAAALDMSYDAAKRQRRKLITHLKACLGKE